MRPLADLVIERLGQMVGPVTVQATLDLEFDETAGFTLGDLHCYFPADSPARFGTAGASPLVCIPDWSTTTSARRNRSSGARQGSFRLSRGRVLTTSHVGTTLVMGICAGSAPRRIRAANSPVCLPIW